MSLPARAQRRLRRPSRLRRPTVTAGEGAAVRLVLLDAFELRCDRRVDLPTSAQRLLAFVGLRSGELLRTHVAGALWPDANEEHAQGSLRSALWRLRQTGLDLVRTRGHRLALGDRVDIDVRETRALAHRLLDPEDDRATELAVAPLVAALSGDLLPDWYDDWVLIEREHLRQLRVHALEALVDRLIAAGRLASAAEAALAAVSADPLRESPHRALIRVHLAEGNAADALRQYRFFRNLSRERLGLVPSSQMEDLIRAIPQAQASDAPVTVA
jgi:DNA-binding SARP family transcriptional activator